MKNYASLFLTLLSFLTTSTLLAQHTERKLIAHRGGVVDSTLTENGLPALKMAMKNGYAMIETDMRITKDGVLIANHDATFDRYYGVNKKVTDMNWADIRKLTSKLDKNKPLKLEEVFSYCASNHIGVMIDNKIAGLDSLVFNKLIKMLDQYHLRENALMIGTDESTEFFTGKIKLSCTREQLVQNQQRSDYQPGHYFLFERPAKISQEDVRWAKDNHIQLVAAINKFHYKNAPDALTSAKADCEKMKAFGVQYFQIDSEFYTFLK